MHRVMKRRVMKHHFMKHHGQARENDQCNFGDTRPRGACARIEKGPLMAGPFADVAILSVDADHLVFRVIGAVFGHGHVP